MAEKYGQRPADLLAGEAGALALDLAVWEQAMRIESKVSALAREDKGEDKAKGYIRMLERAAKAEEVAGRGD